MAPSLALRRITTVDNRTIQHADIGARSGLCRITCADDELSGELVLRNTDLSGRDEIER